MLSPEQIAASGTEHAHQAAIFQFMATSGARLMGSQAAYLFAVPNGADYGGRAQVGARMRAEGLKSGVPDMFWPYPVANVRNASRWPGLWLELKRPGMHTRKYGDRSDKQVEWHHWLRSFGWPVVTAYGWRAGVRTLILYWRGELLMDGADCKLMWEGCPELPDVPEESW